MNSPAVKRNITNLEKAIETQILSLQKKQSDLAALAKRLANNPHTKPQKKHIKFVFTQAQIYIKNAIFLIEKMFEITPGK